MLVASAASALVLAALLSGLVAVRKSMSATHHYATNVANESRLLDYVARDLRQAVRVGILSGGTNTTFKAQTNVAVTATNILTINIPDFYGSNTPNNAAGSTYKSKRYGTATTNPAVTWAEAVTSITGGKRVTRFAPAASGNGEIQVRYYRGPRSASDATACYFRSEYAASSGTLLSTREIAERITDNAFVTGLTLTGSSDGLTFRVQSSFASRYRTRDRTTAGTEAYVLVGIRNLRRD